MACSDSSDLLSTEPACSARVRRMLNSELVNISQQPIQLGLVFALFEERRVPHLDCVAEGPWQGAEILRERDARTRAILAALPDRMLVIAPSGELQQLHATERGFLPEPTEDLLGRIRRAESALRASLQETTDDA